VTIQDFRGKTLVSIREYYKKDGKELPTSKGCLCYLFCLGFLFYSPDSFGKGIWFWIEAALKVFIFLVFFEIGDGWRFCFNFFNHVQILFVNFMLISREGNWKKRSFLIFSGFLTHLCIVV